MPQSSAFRDRLTLSSPDSFLASIPHMVGFGPENSVVMVGISPARDGQSSSVLLTQRFDIPSMERSDAELGSLARAVSEPMARVGSSEVIVAVFQAHRPDPGEALPCTPLVDELVEALDEQDIIVKDALYTDGTSRWSYGCDDPACCPAEGRVIPQEVRAHVAAEFAGMGVAMVPDRAAIVAEVAPGDADRISHVRELLADVLQARDESPRGLEQWRDAAIGQVDRLTASTGPVDDELTAHVLAGLGDVRVRDTALWELSRPDVDQHHAVAGLTSLVRSAPPGHVAPAATTLAIVHWMGGDGARASVALDRALADDPDYSLARMVHTALGSGLPPQAWRESMASLSREECRYGQRPAAPVPVDAGMSSEISSPGLAG